MTGKLKTFEVRYSITREEIYRVQAASRDEAEEIAFEDGENVGMGETTNVSHISTSEVAEIPAAKTRRSKGGPRP
jgi:hypothetical protein